MALQTHGPTLHAYIYGFARLIMETMFSFSLFSYNHFFKMNIRESGPFCKCYCLFGVDPSIIEVAKYVFHHLKRSKVPRSHCMALN